MGGYAQAVQNQAAEQQQQRAAKAALYWNAVQTPLPKPDDPAYQQAVAKREGFLKDYITTLGPEQHATVGNRLHALIFGPEKQEMDQAKTPPVPPPANAAPSAPTHPFENNPQYSEIQKGLTALGTRLKGFAHPLPAPAQPDYAALATVPGAEDIKRQDVEATAKNAQSLEKEKGDVAKEVARIRANGAGTSTPEKAFLNSWAKKNGADGYAALTPDQQVSAVTEWKKANATPARFQFKVIDGNLYSANPSDGSLKFIAPAGSVTATQHVFHSTNALTGEITAVPYTTYTSKQSGKVIASDAPAGASSSPVSSQAPQLPQQPTSALNHYTNPEDQPPQVSLAFNRQWAKQGPYATKLDSAQEMAFRKWAASHQRLVDGEVGQAPDFSSLPESDYDVRGHWLAAQKGDPRATLTPNKWDGKLHGNDAWKTPYDGSFSRESIYALPSAPRWVGDKLMTADGKLVTDETPKKPISSQAPNLAASNADIAAGNASSKKLNKGKPKSSHAPVSPNVVAHTASLLNKADATQYTKIAEDANTKKEAFLSAQQALKNPTPSSDQELVYQWVRSNVQGAGRMTQAEFQQALAVGSLPLRAQTAWERTKTGRLPPELEQQFFADIKRSYEISQKEADGLRGQLGGNPVSSQAPNAPSGNSIWNSLPSAQ